MHRPLSAVRHPFQQGVQSSKSYIYISPNPLAVIAHICTFLFFSTHNPLVHFASLLDHFNSLGALCRRLGPLATAVAAVPSRDEPGRDILAME